MQVTNGVLLVRFPHHWHWIGLGNLSDLDSPNCKHVQEILVIVIQRQSMLWNQNDHKLWNCPQRCFEQGKNDHILAGCVGKRNWIHGRSWQKWVHFDHELTMSFGWIWGNSWQKEKDSNEGVPTFKAWVGMWQEWLDWRQDGFDSLQKSNGR